MTVSLVVVGSFSTDFFGSVFLIVTSYVFFVVFGFSILFLIKFISLFPLGFNVFLASELLLFLSSILIFEFYVSDDLTVI